MKKFSQIFAAVIILFGLGISQSFAGKIVEMEEERSDFKVAFLPQNLDQMVVSFENEGEDVELNLKNADGESVHTEAVSGKGVFAKRYDFSELDNGIYSFEIKKGQEKTIRTVVLK